MSNFKIVKGNKGDLPETLSNDILYIVTSQTENEYSEMIVDEQHFPSQQYIDQILEEIDKLLKEL